MHVNMMDQIDDRPSGKPLPPWIDAAEDPIAGNHAVPPEPAVIEKPLSTLALELKKMVIRDQKSRIRRER